MSKIIHHTLGRGPSKRGWHVLRNYLQCGLKGTQAELSSPRELPKGPGLLPGLMFAAFHEIARGRGGWELDTSTVVFDDGQSTYDFMAARSVAESYFRQYRATVPEDYWGSVLGVEKTVERKLGAVGTVTARLDLLVRRDTQTPDPAHSTRRRVYVPDFDYGDLSAGSLWSIDQKLENGSSDPARYFYDPQFWIQKALMPKLAGVMVDITYKTRLASFATVVLPASWLEARRPALDAALEVIAREIDNPMPHITSCIGPWGRPCQFLSTCSQTPHSVPQMDESAARAR